MCFEEFVQKVYIAANSKRENRRVWDDYEVIFNLGYSTNQSINLSLISHDITDVIGISIFTYTIRYQILI